MRERSVLGADTKNEQHVVVSNVTTAYSAETPVLMDCLEAHPNSSGQISIDRLK
jgi:hypothetical protein